MTNDELEILNKKRLQQMEELDRFLKTATNEQKAEVFENVKQRILNSEQPTPFHKVAQIEETDLLAKNLTDKEFGE
ncbi:hypothetical protein HYG93_19020 [Acinetobacter sp. SwsAc6]|uniref:hypothetical protein n=1 Tax=Acinetobacter sp. SwsAc6 TaxID=2749439 RepID=UPI0015BCD27A|nr:hypothetical protein [Acinetobacter sp. SwsAc6]NWK76295.1 hypothetical protein [Acinetobacter sp. SwsAc6]